MSSSRMSILSLGFTWRTLLLEICGWVVNTLDLKILLEFEPLEIINEIRNLLHLLNPHGRFKYHQKTVNKTVLKMTGIVKPNISIGSHIHWSNLRIPIYRFYRATLLLHHFDCKNSQIHACVSTHTKNVAFVVFFKNGAQTIVWTDGWMP